MEVDVGIKVLTMEVIELWGSSTWDVIIAQVFTDHSAILGLCQRIIVGVAWV